MDQLNHVATQGLSGASKTTQALVAAYHFLVALILVSTMVLLWLRTDEETYLPMPGVLLPTVAGVGLIYFLAGLGIAWWKNWARTLSLVINWLNVGAAVFAVMRFRISPAGAISVTLSCLVLWWLHVPGVAFQFRQGGRVQ